MTGFYIVLGVSVSLAALGAFAFALGYLIRSVAVLAQGVSTLLPPTGQFLGTVADLRVMAEPARTSAGAAPLNPLAAGDGLGAVPWPTRAYAGVAPPPVDVMSGTSAQIPPTPAGDRDWFDDTVVNTARPPMAEPPERGAR